jgi:tetratricopeptide (TPR) repeat protein
MFSSKYLLVALVPVLALALEPQSEKSPAMPPASMALPASHDSVAVTTPDRPVLTPESRGDIFMARKMYREAIDQYRKMPPTAVILNKIGIAYHQTSDLRAAERYYKRAIKADSKYPEAVNNLGTIYYVKRSYRRAVKEYEKALKLNPNSASVYSNLGTAHFARKEYKDAFDAYRKAIQLDPDVFERHDSYGVMLQPTAIEERARYHYYLAKMYAQAGMIDRSIQCVRKALEEGFKQPKKFVEEPEFAVLKDNVEFQALMAQEPRAL